MTKKPEKKYFLFAILVPCLIGILIIFSLSNNFSNIILFKIVVELLKTCIYIFLINEIVKIMIHQFGAPKVITSFLNSVATCLIIFNGVYHILVILGVNSKTLQSSSVIIALIIGAASKKTIANLIAGVFLEVEDLIHPFDFIVIKKYMGIVVDKNLFYITIEDGDENRKKIRSKDFTNFNNASFNHSTIYIDAKVSVKVPMIEIDQVVNAVLENPEQKFTTFVEIPVFLGIEKFKDGKMYLRFMGRCKGKDRKKSIVSLTLAIDKAFTQKGVELLLPQVEIV